MAASEKKPKPKQYQSRYRLTWAADFPLKPGRDIMSRRGLLVLIAQTAVRGEFWQAIKTQEADRTDLAERAGLHEASVRRLLVKLCAEGALRGQARGYKRTTRYTLLRLDEVEQNGGKFLPAEPPMEAQQRFPRTGADRASTRAYIGDGLEPDQPGKNGLERASTRGREDLTARLHAPRKRLRDKEKKNRKYRKPNGLLDATANGAPRLPSASIQTLSSFSSTEEEDTHLDQYPISSTARTLSDFVSGGTGRPLPGSWLFYPGLERQLDRRNFLEVGSILAGILGRSGGALPEPEAFFQSYGQYRQVHLAVQSHRRNGKRRRWAA